MGDEINNTTTDTTAPAAPVTTASPAPVTPPAQVTAAPAAKTFTQEEVNQIVSKRLEEDRTRRAPAPALRPAAVAPAATPPAGNDPPSSGMPDIQAMIVREGDFREEMVRSGASPEQIGLLRTLLTIENPADVRTWCQQKASIMGLGKSPAPPAVTQPATATPAPEAPKPPPPAAPSAPSGNALPTVNGVVDIFSLPEAQIRAMPPSQIRAVLEQASNIGNQAAGMPQRPKPPSQQR